MFTQSEAGKLGYQKTQTFLEAERTAQVEAARRRYELNAPRCRSCSAPIPYEKRANKFCNHSCAARFNNLGVIHNSRNAERRTHCLLCDKRIQGTGKVYCSTRCSHTHKAEKFAERYFRDTSAVGSGSLPAIRRYLLRVRGESCQECGWEKRNPVTGRVPLEVDHKDGNFENNSLENLRLICPNCHSLTPTFRNLNKGNGRAYRRKTPE